MPSSSAAADAASLPSPAGLGLALLAFHRTIGPIRKQSEAKYGKFADLNTVLEAVTPALIEQGLVLTQLLEDTTGGGQRLTTRLTHAPSGESIVSTCLLPTLQQLLDRVHDLRQSVVARFPLDLQLAAIGALPPVLPPRTADPSAELPPPPKREPGLRIEDQIKALYTLLGQLGTTTNPLHSLGGTITYLRRYQILAILSLAPTDDDGQAYDGHTASPVQAAPQGQGQPQGQPAAAPRRRSSRTPKPQPTPPPAAQHPDPAPQAPQEQAPQEQAPQAQAPQAQAQPVQPIAPQQQADAPGADAAQADETTQAPPPLAATDSPLLPAEVQQLIALIRTLPSDRVAELVQLFRQQFGLQPSVLVSDYIKTHQHAQFIRQQVAVLAPEPAAAAA
jgi:hypothetical protein